MKLQRVRMSQGILKQGHNIRFKKDWWTLVRESKSQTRTAACDSRIGMLERKGNNFAAFTYQDLAYGFTNNDSNCSWTFF